jgi:hypothetical protein
MEAALSIDTTVIVQDYVNVFELFDVARAAAIVEDLGYTTWLDGTVRTLQTHPGTFAEQIIQRYDASGRPYPVDDEVPHGWAMVTFTTDNRDQTWPRHGWFLHDIGRWLATVGVRWCRQGTGELWVVGDGFARQHS